MTTRTITFIEPWGRRSWKVAYDGPYENDRLPHVEVGERNMARHTAGETHALSNLHVDRRSVQWDIPGCVGANGGVAHFTVYFGPDARDKLTTLS